MRILAADDEQAALNVLTRAIAQAAPEAEITALESTQQICEALRAERKPFDIAFLDIEMPGMSGLALARALQQHHAQTNLVFVTAHPQYALQAFELYPSGYLMKPITGEKIAAQLEHLRHIPPVRARRAKLRVQCFGNFEVFAGERPLRFRYAKSKELLAYLIDRRGACVSTGELLSVLFEEKPSAQATKSYLRNCVADLARSLAGAHAADVLLRENGGYAVCAAQLDCDYYAYLHGDGAPPYAGEYMAQYSWAELTTAELEQLRK